MKAEPTPIINIAGFEFPTRTSEIIPVSWRWEVIMGEQALQSFIARARSLSELSERERSTLLTVLICEAIPFGLVTESEFFYAAYGDRRGRKYWEAFLSEPVPVGKLAFVLSVHLPVRADQLEWQRAEILLALADAAEAGEPWFIGNTAALLAFRQSRNGAELAAIKVRPRAAVEWFLAMPKREHLVPDSLRSFLEDKPGARIKPPVLSRRTAERFVAEFIDCERKAGREPTLTGLEKAAKNARIRGGRDRLREAFRRTPNVTVRRGRPTKSAEK